MGKMLMFLIHWWLKLSGKKVDLTKNSWLAGPYGKTDVIGEGFYREWAQQGGYEISINQTGEGLMTDFSVFDSDTFQSKAVHAAIRNFYTHTTDFSLEVWNEWNSLMKHFAAILIKNISPHMKQMNLPLHSLDTSYGMSSNIIQFKKEGKHQFTCWFRTNMKTDEVIYAGFYSVIKLPASGKVCVRTVFPLPQGSVTIILQPEQQPDGSFKFISAGKKFGEPGYYRLHYLNDNTVKVCRLPIRESIHLFTDKTGTLRTNHDFSWWSIKFLRLHYKIGMKVRKPKEVEEIEEVSN